MKTLFRIALLLTWLYILQADELQVHQQPSYLSLAPSKTDGNDNRFTVNTLTNNLLILLGLSPDHSEEKEEPFFYSSRPLQGVQFVWLFHVEGLDHLSKTGIPLVEADGFHIDRIETKLSEIGDSNALSSGTIFITSEADLNNFDETIRNQVSQMNANALMKYVIVLCDECNGDQAIGKVDKALDKSIDEIIAKDSQALVMTLVTKQTARVRRARQAERQETNVTIATFYSDEYPTMFNLFFWTSLVFAIIIIAIVYVFLTLDPGSDSVIYRTTAPRLKTE